MTRRRGSDRSEKGRGRTQRTIRRGILLTCFMLGGSMVLARAVQLQVIEHERWAAAAEDQHRERLELPPRRGSILDRNGVPVALSHEMYQVSIAPSELRDRDAAARSLAEGLGLSRSQALRAVDPDRRWVVLPGRYTVEQRQKVGTIRGVYFERRFERFYPQGEAGREVIGAVTRDGRALGGIEQEMDSILRGVAGYSVLRRDARGEAMPTISLPVVPPTDGADVHLTIDFDIQEIADAALRDAIEKTGATGGDLLIGDPRTGEVLAAVSRRSGGRTRALASITEPYEPGSTLKPFVAATLLTEGVATEADSVFAEEGIWRDGSRTIRDTSPHGWLSLRESLEVSSNIAFAKFARRLSPGQQYSYLRDFGLGTLTGIEYPSESGGRLRKPAEWSRLSSASLAMGYELSVTPLQMLAAYGALANGGILMEPYLVREIRSADGRVIERRNPKAVRRVVPEEVAENITDMLVGVVEGGTASRASLTTFAVAGKTGTSRRTSRSGGYAPGAYTSTFAGYFPAQDPRIVIFVKLDEPRGEYYGGLTAAPVTRETLRGILAARTGAIDGPTLLASRAGYEPAPKRVPLDPGDPAEPADESSYVLSIAEQRESVPGDAETEAPVVEVPTVEGLDVRAAAKALHAAGFQVRVAGSGRVSESKPSAGSTAARGSVVTLITESP